MLSKYSLMQTSVNSLMCAIKSFVLISWAVVQSLVVSTVAQLLDSEQSGRSQSGAADPFVLIDPLIEAGKQTADMQQSSARAAIVLIVGGALTHLLVQMQEVLCKEVTPVLKFCIKQFSFIAASRNFFPDCLVSPPVLGVLVLSAEKSTLQDLSIENTHIIYPESLDIPDFLGSCCQIRYKRHNLSRTV